MAFRAGVSPASTLKRKPTIGIASVKFLVVTKEVGRNYIKSSSTCMVTLVIAERIEKCS